MYFPGNFPILLGKSVSVSETSVSSHNIGKIYVLFKLTLRPEHFPNKFST
jgi:hypothetical protein